MKMIEDGDGDWKETKIVESGRGRGFLSGQRGELVGHVRRRGSRKYYVLNRCRRRLSFFSQSGIASDERRQ